MMVNKIIKENIGNKKILIGNGKKYSSIGN